MFFNTRRPHARQLSARTRSRTAANKHATHCKAGKRGEQRPVERSAAPRAPPNTAIAAAAFHSTHSKTPMHLQVASSARQNRGRDADAGDPR